MIDQDLSEKTTPVRKREFNYPRLKARDWGSDWSRLKPRSGHAGYHCETLKSSSSWDSAPWFSIYSFNISSVTLPLEATKYPLAQRCWPQNAWRNFRKSIKRWWDVLPFIACMTRLGEIFGGTSSNKCTWSGLTCPFMMTIPRELHISRTRSRNRSATSPTKTGLRYLGMKTKW